MLNGNIFTTWKSDNATNKISLQYYTTHIPALFLYPHTLYFMNASNTEQARGWEGKECWNTTRPQRVARVSLLIALLQISWQLSQPPWDKPSQKLRTAPGTHSQFECAAAATGCACGRNSLSCSLSIRNIFLGMLLSAITLAVLLPGSTDSSAVRSAQPLSCTQLGAQL